MSWLALNKVGKVFCKVKISYNYSVNIQCFYLCFYQHKNALIYNDIILNHFFRLRQSSMNAIQCFKANIYLVTVYDYFLTLYTRSNIIQHLNKIHHILVKKISKNTIFSHFQHIFSIFREFSCFSMYFLFNFFFTKIGL